MLDARQKVPTVVRLFNYEYLTIRIFVEGHNDAVFSVIKPGLLSLGQHTIWNIFKLGYNHGWGIETGVNETGVC